MNPTDLSEEMRKKLAAKAKNKPDYKTRLCKNFEETGECDYGEICNYAHGKEELNTDAIKAKSALEEIVKKNPAYRTSLCKSGTNCRYEKLALQKISNSARTPRTPKSIREKIHCLTTDCAPRHTCALFRNKDTTCQFAHTQDELRTKENSGDPFGGNIFGSGSFGFGIGGPGFGPYPAGPSGPSMPPQGGDPLYKTKVLLINHRQNNRLFYRLPGFPWSG